MNSDSVLSYDVLLNEDVYIRENAVTILPIVRDCIKKSKDDEFVLRAIDIMTSIFLECFSIEEYEDSIFKLACPAAKSIFCSTLKGIEGFKANDIQTQTDHADTYFNLLNICIHIIESFHTTYRHLNNLEVIAVNNVKSLLESTAEILYYTYEHCKNGEQLYSDYFCKVNDILTKLYKTAAELQRLFLNFLTRVQFNCEIEEDIELLDNMLIYLYKLSLTLMTVDVKTMAESWKTYAALNGKFSEVIKDRHNIGEPIKKLCDYLLTLLEDILSKEINDKEIIVKNSKVASFLLKLVIKFCELYNGYVTDCHSSLVNLLIYLCRYNQSFMEFIEIPNDVSECTKQIIIGSEPLLAHLLSDKGIVRKFSQIAGNLEKNSDVPFGFLILCCRVLKKLMHSDLETRRLWFNESRNIVEWVFLSLNFCQWELNSNLKFQSVSVPGKQKRYTDLYEYVFINVTGFVLLSNSKEFPYIEKVLLKNILQTNPWLALLAMDVWCVLARFANAELCCSQLIILSKMLSQLPVESCQPEKIYLACLVQRLFPLMIQKDQDSFVKLFPVNEYSHLWATFGVHNLSPTYRIPLQNQLHQLAVENFKKFSNYGSLYNFYKLEKSLLGANQTIHRENKEIVEIILILWKFDLNDSISKLFLKRYIKMLIYPTCGTSELLSPSDLRTILAQIQKIILTFENSTMQLYFTSIMHQLATINIPPGNSQQTVMKSIASTFKDLLTSNNIFVKQRTLEIFSEFAKVTKHGDIVRFCTLGNNSLQSDITNYIKKNLNQKRDSDVFFKKENVEYLHVCEEEEENYEPIAQKPKLDESVGHDADFQVVINRIRSDAKILNDCYDLLSSEQKREVKDIRDYFTLTIEKS